MDLPLSSSQAWWKAGGVSSKEQVSANVRDLHVCEYLALVVPGVLHPWPLTAPWTGHLYGGTPPSPWPQPWPGAQPPSTALDSRLIGCICSTPATPWTREWSYKEEQPSPDCQRLCAEGAAQGGFPQSQAEAPPQCTELQAPVFLLHVHTCSWRGS